MTSCDPILFETKMSFIHLIIILSCWSAYTRVLAQTGCDGWFGPGCKYQCHCTEDRCRRDGNCPLGCAKGWFGPQCQYEDIGQPYGNSFQQLFDGDEASCIRITEGKIYLETEIAFTWMRLHFERHVEQDQVSIEFYKTWNQPSIKCDKGNVSIVKNGVLDIHCDVHSTIRTIIIKMTSQARLCSVYVSGGRNIALKQKTSQTSTYFHVNSYDFSRSENAVDGNTDGYFYQQSCTRTDSNEQKPSWTVMLSGHHEVNRYRIYNRKDPAKRDRLRGFKLTSYDAHNKIVFDYQSPSLEVNDLFTIMHKDGVGKQVSRVTIEVMNEEKVLNLCEVEIFGDSICSIGWYGRDCEYRCNCADRTEACHVSTGGCASGCADGFTGEGCQTGCAGWFGPGCKYQCHCKQNNCTRDGNCPSGCARGWFGPQCQYEDIGQLSRTVPKLLIDGDEASCLKTAEVQIEWNTAIPFTWMRLNFENHVDQDQVSIEFYKTLHPPTIECGKRNVSIVENGVLDIHCDVQSTVNTILLKWSSQTPLCSVYVSGGRNIALKQNTEQTGTYFYLNTYDYSRSENAVDGNTDGYFDQQSCTHTNSTFQTPSWTVRLSGHHVVNRYRIYNRKDENNRDRLKGFKLTSYDARNTNVFYYWDKSSVVYDTYTVIHEHGVGKQTSQVTIEGRHGGKFLNLCEVQVFGDSICSFGRYGRDCEHTCNCADRREGCHMSTGGCASGCAAGYTGEGCRAECPPKLYGTDCKLSCDISCLDQLCHNVNGSCKACSSGKMGDRCDQDCVAGKYGLGCRETCSTNCGGDGGCNPDSGHCNYRCNDGYTGDRCEKECDVTLYGQGCNTNCSEFCLSGVTNSNTTAPQRACDLVTGECLKGCRSGYEGIHCLTASPATSGADTGVIVGPLIAVIILAVIMALGVVFWRKRKIRKQKHFIGLATHQNAPEPVVSNSKTTVIQAQKTRDPNAYDPTPSGEITDDVYCNPVTGGRQKTSISLEHLNNYMITHNNAFFEEQFKNIPANVNVSMSVGLSAENKAKNRYKNISAYDHSRVHLISCPEKKHGDYINASFVKDYKDDKRFIASQGPNKVIVEDFIRMLWEQKVEKVVMLTNLIEEAKHKCDQYWPEDGEMHFGEIRVRLINTLVFADYTIRKLELLKTGETTQQLTHFHFTSWPDKGVPKTAWSLVDFEQRVSLFPSNSPVVVHCSAGVGRTGTFIALHNLIAEAKETGQLDFCTTLWKLRQDRVYMIQTAEQYIFLHKAVQMAMICVDTTVHVSDIIDRIKKLEARSSRGQSNFEKEFKSICTVCADKEDGKDEEGSGGSIAGLYHNSKSLNNKLKNRFSNILPKDQYRPFLFCETKDVSDYINAVFVPSLTKPNHQILTQLPLPTTVVDFWRLVTQYRVTLIVAFELDLKEADSTIGSYLPTNMSEPMTCGNINVEAGAVHLGASWEEQNISITVQKRKKSLIPTPTTHSHFVDLSVTHLKYTSTVYNTEKFLAFLSHARSCGAHQGKVLYTCRNGADMSGLACVLSLLLDRIDNDHYLTVPLVVGAVKTIRQQVIPTLDQYKMLYQLVKLYSESGSVYYNRGHANNTSKGQINPAFVSTSDEDRYVYANL